MDFNTFCENLVGRGQKVDDVTIIIFGASGDLTSKKLIPALFRLFKTNLLPETFSIIGFGRTDMDSTSYRNDLSKEGKYDSDFLSQVEYFSGNYDSDSCLCNFVKFVEDLEVKRGGSGNRLCYLSTPPSIVEGIVENIKKCNLISDSGKKVPWGRVIFEKPFGRDFESAMALNAFIGGLLGESQIYRIDHYLGKETVQNILVFRFANSVFGPLLNNQYVKDVQITVAESIGVDDRGGYFDNSGTLRDMMQNHMSQLLTLIAMEAPVSFDPRDIHKEKTKVLRSLRKYTEEGAIKNSVRAQYIAGEVGGESVVGYLDEKDVKRDSLTETYVAIKLFIDNWRWVDVPFFLRVGKRLERKTSEIVINFKSLPLSLFRCSQFEDVEGNSLVIRVQPEEGISIRFNSKVPGYQNKLKPVEMDFFYDESFDAELPDAYERLLLDAIQGDNTLFIEKQEIELSWDFFDVFLKAWSSRGVDGLLRYKAGTVGPKEADLLFEGKGSWKEF